jgi:multidrug efflux system membrane fusion protein
MTYIKHAIAATGILFLLAACSANADENTAPKARVVKVAGVSQKAMAFPIRTVGKLTSETEMRLSFKIGGIINNINVKEGQTVRKGQVLASLKTDEIQNQVIQAENGLAKANRDLGRVQNLYRDSVATLEQLQNAETAANVAKASYDIAVFNLNYARIKAPSDGRILFKLAETEELVGAGHPVIVFASGQSQWTLRSGLADQFINTVALGDSALVNFDLYPGIDFTGVIHQTAAGANPMTGLFEIEIALDPPKRRLYSGLIGKVNITPGNKQNYSFIPVESLHSAVDNQAVVFVPSAEYTVALKKTITTVGVFEEQVAVATGLENVKEVITAGNAYLTEGSLITLANEEK